MCGLPVGAVFPGLVLDGELELLREGGGLGIGPGYGAVIGCPLECADYRYYSPSDLATTDFMTSLVPP